MRLSSDESYINNQNCNVLDQTFCESLFWSHLVPVASQTLQFTYCEHRLSS